MRAQTDAVSVTLTAEQWFDIRLALLDEGRHPYLGLAEAILEQVQL